MNSILNSLDRYAEALENASIWHNSREVLSEVKDSEDNYIYEFYIYLRLLSDLKHNYKLEFYEGYGDFKNKFPKGPAPKAGKPFFKILNENGEVMYHVCAGTEIKVKYGSKTASPDISFQSPNSSEDPSANDVKIIIDAKYNKKKKKISKGQFAYFSMMVRDLDVLSAKLEAVTYSELFGLRGNCLITFGEAFTDDQQYLNPNNFMEIEFLNEDDNFRMISE